MQSVTGSAVVYCDPPYVPITETSNFSDYTKEGFSPKDQQDLAAHARALCAQGIPIIISNHDTKFTREIYADAAISHFEVQRFISSKASNRAKAAELLAVFI